MRKIPIRYIYKVEKMENIIKGQLKKIKGILKLFFV